MESHISGWTISAERMVNAIGRHGELSSRVMSDVLEWYTKIGICMIDILGSLYNQQVDDIKDLSVDHDSVIRPLWAALMYYSAPSDQKWIWKDEAISLVMPFSLFSEAMREWFGKIEQVEYDQIEGELDEDQDDDDFWY